MCEKAKNELVEAVLLLILYHSSFNRFNTVVIGELYLLRMVNDVKDTFLMKPIVSVRKARKLRTLSCDS